MRLIHAAQFVSLFFQQVPLLSQGLVLTHGGESQGSFPNATLKSDGKAVPDSVNVQRQSVDADASLNMWWAHQKMVRSSALAMNEDLLVTPMGKAHPCWNFEWWQLKEWMVYLCCVVLFFAGVLCSAGGIGGGGVYVTVLMVAGGLPIEDAVPLSKSIVFSGSLSTLFLNLRKSFSSGSGLIDYNICRLVVPGALVGTYVGVLLNSILPGWLIALILCGILIFITTMVTRTTYKQWKEEKAESQGSTNGPQPASAGPPSAPSNASISAGGDSKYVSLRTKCTPPDMIAWFLCLLTVIFFSVFRYHAGKCQHAEPSEREEVCNHRVMGYFGKGTMEKWMQNDASATAATIVSFIIPIGMCLSTTTAYTTRLVLKEGWSLTETLKYTCMAISTGILAGLVGIGGGLIFSPFLLVTGTDPAIAVATSSTCVIFTSSSTTLQYLLEDRIIMGLTVIYGVINLVASYVGTKCVHYVQERWGAKKSLISMIVLAGVVVSTILAIIKFVQSVMEKYEHQDPVTHRYIASQRTGYVLGF